MAHLLDRGFCRIAFVGDPEGSSDAAERWAGFLHADRAAGLELAFAPRPSLYREQVGRESARELLTDGHRPDAIVAANDEIAMGTLRAARELSTRVPEELAVTAWDDIPGARHLAPALTTVRQLMAELGAQAAVLLAEQVDNRRTDPRHGSAATRAVVRSSCACGHPT